MDTGHWIIMGMTAAMLITLWMTAAVSSPKSRGYRCAQRIFWAFTMLWVSGGLGGIGLNGVNLILTSVLGLPGYGALLALSKL